MQLENSNHSSTSKSNSPSKRIDIEFFLANQKEKKREEKKNSDIIECPTLINMMMTATVKRQRDG